MTRKILSIVFLFTCFIQVAHSQNFPLGIQIPTMNRTQNIQNNLSSPLNAKKRTITQTVTEKNASDSLISNRKLAPTNLIEIDTALVSYRKKIFGYSIFNNKIGVFEPNLKIATPKSYVLGPDDEIIIDINGYSEEHYTLPITPDGYVKINRLGNVYLAGLTIEEAKTRLINKLSKIFIGLKRDNASTSSFNNYASISLGNIRTVNVTVQGEVMFPGTYSVPSLARVMNILYLAGGPNENGTFRNIQIIRNNKLFASVDLYDFLTSGIQKNDINIQDQDIIKVGVYKNRIEIRGKAKRQGYFETLPNENLETIINEFSGGFSDDAYKELVKVTRYTNKDRRLIDLNSNFFNSFYPSSGDLIQIESLNQSRIENKITVIGEVFRPGDFSSDNNSSLLKIIERAGGLKENAFLDRITIERINEDLTPSNLSVNLRDLKLGKTNDIKLKREDKITIYSIFDLRENYTVTIHGEINFKRDVNENQADDDLNKLDNVKSNRKDLNENLKKSTTMLATSANVKNENNANKNSDDDLLDLDPIVKLTIPYTEKMTVEDLILKAGGLKESAATGFVEVIRRKKNLGIDNPELINSKIAEIIRFGISKNLQVDQTASTFILNPFDEIFIRSSPNYELQQFVTLKGQVIFPGLYGLEKKNERLSEIVIRAGGLNKQAYPEGAKLIRKINKSEIEKNIRNEQFDELTDNFSNVVIKKEPESKKVTETIGIDLVDALANPEEENDLFINDGDIIEIPKEPQTVKVSGEVLYPNSIKYLANKKFGDYISDAGGFTFNSSRNHSYVLYSNGSIRRTKSFLFFKTNPKIEKGAEIIVPAKTRNVNSTQQIVSMVSILTGSITSVIGIITLIKATAK